MPTGNVPRKCVPRNGLFSSPPALDSGRASIRPMSRGFPDVNAELTHILVVVDIARSRDWYEDVLGAEKRR
jgi:hypothetical protein